MPRAVATEVISEQKTEGGKVCVSSKILKRIQTFQLESRKGGIVTTASAEKKKLEISQGRKGGKWK